MKPPELLVLPALLVFSVFGSDSFAAGQIILQFEKTDSHSELGLHSQLDLPVNAMYSDYSILCSTNMTDWQTVADPISGGVGVSDELLRVAVPLAGDHVFYRVVANLKLAPTDDRPGDAMYGYGTQFSRELQGIGQLPLDEFVGLYGPTNQYLEHISFDPTTGEFWEQFNLDPAVHNATNSVDPRLTDFRLNAEEFALFQTNGFVVSPRLGSYSFADAFYKIYTDDLAVFFSADAALQAWHRSYMGMLEEVEETYLSPWNKYILEGMASQVPGLWSQAQGTAMVNGVKDADYFLAVALSLLNGANNFGYLSQNAQIQDTLTAINNLQPATVVMFGTNRLVDFSQFQVRGHYETSQILQRYFRAMMWCSLIDFRFSGFEFTSPVPTDNSLRELSGAIAMNMLMSRAGMLNSWLEVDNVVQTFVGAPDSLTFAQLSDLLAAVGISTPANVPNTAALTNLQAKIMSGQYGVQNIRSGYFWSPLSHDQIKLPRSFTVMGQRFVVDAWAHSMCVFDSIIWDEDGIPDVEDKVMRRVPSALDVAFAVLGNNQVVPEIADRISKTNLTLADGRPFFRDGLNYQHNLAAVRNVVDAQNAGAWTNNIYNCWLACLRELSTPTAKSGYPESMRTWPWAMKSLNTQLASWTELRHDTVLYAKQPYTGILLCSYPDGYVEPLPGFWLKMKEMALRTKTLVSAIPDYIPQAPYYDFVFEANPGDTAFTVSLETIRANRVQFLDTFASTMATLQGISEKELAHTTLTANEVMFLQGLMEDRSAVYTGTKTYSGWYPQLYFLNARAQRSIPFYSPSDAWDALVTDVLTDPPNPLVGDPGSILHEGVGNVHLLMVTVDSGPGDIAVYAGPVMSHYEFELGPTTRETDSEWKTEIRSGTLPPEPDWTRTYLVPGPYSIPYGVQ
jgi:hypothetical protein